MIPLQDEGFDVQTAGYGKYFTKKLLFPDFCWSYYQWTIEDYLV